MAKTVADQFAQILIAAGVKRIYGIVGDSLNGLTDSIRRQGKIEWVHVRHEEVAAFAAGAEAHLTGELAVCAGSCGPGNLHLINGLFDCHRSRVPVLAIAAQIPSSEIGSGYFQETHPLEERFHIFTEHAPVDLVINQTYLGIERSADAIVVQATPNKGRDAEVKRGFYRTLADLLRERIGLRQEDLVINLVEVKRENWSLGNGKTQLV